MPSGITGIAIQELQPPSHPPHQSQVEMSEIAKIQRPFTSRILFKDKVYLFVRNKLLSLKLVETVGNVFPSKEIQL